MTQQILDSHWDINIITQFVNCCYYVYGPDALKRLSQTESLRFSGAVERLLEADNDGQHDQLQPRIWRAFSGSRVKSICPSIAKHPLILIIVTFLTALSLLKQINKLEETGQIGVCACRKIRHQMWKPIRLKTAFFSVTRLNVRQVVLILDIGHIAYSQNFLFKFISRSQFDVFLMVQVGLVEKNKFSRHSFVHFCTPA